MKKRTMLFSIISAVLIVLVGAGIAIAKPFASEKITGDTYFLMEEWGNVEIRNTIVVKTDPLTGAIKGKITVKVTSPYQESVRSYETAPVCASFYEDEDGTPWAIVVHRISADGVSGFDPGLPGEYAKWKIHDSQVPVGQQDEANFDAIFLAYECPATTWENTCDTDRDGEPDFPYSEFWPADGEPPACDDTGFDSFPLRLDGGNIVIH